jgi:hypothetical protein
VVGGTQRAGRHDRRAVAGEAGDAVDTGGVEGFGEGHCRQDRGAVTKVLPAIQLLYATESLPMSDIIGSSAA